MFVTAMLFLLAIVAIGIAVFFIAQFLDRIGERSSVAAAVAKQPSPWNGATERNLFDRVSCRFAGCGVLLFMGLAMLCAAAELAFKYSDPGMAWVAAGLGVVFLMSWVWAINFFKRDPNRLPDHITRH
jgi:hypothetical protein